MRALVTGGAGFIGSSIATELLRRGHSVVILDDLSTGFAENLPSEAVFYEGVVQDENLVRQAVEGANVIFHQAAHRAVARSVEDPLATDLANVHGTLTLLTAARDAGAGRFVYASSSSIYGGAAALPTPETAPARPRSPYAVTKLAGEHYCRVFSELFGLETVALRYFNVYGPRQRPDSMYAAVIPLFIAALHRGERPQVHGDGRQSRDFTFIDDVVDANMRAAEASADRCSGRAFNIAGGSPYSLLEVLEILGQILGLTPEPLHVSPRAGDVRNSQADPSAALEELGWSARVDLHSGLKHAVDWFRL